MLEPYNSSDPIYFGCKFKPYVSQGYMSGGAGYVLSKEALKRFVKQGVTDETGLTCRHDGEGAEDVELGKCMENLHVKAGDSRDSLGRGRFFPFVPEHHLIPGLVGKDFWYWKYIYYPAEEVSTYTIQTVWFFTLVILTEYSKLHFSSRYWDLRLAKLIVNPMLPAMISSEGTSMETTGPS